MELTPVQRLVTFAIVVLVLAGLGAYLFLPKSSGAAGRPGPAVSASQRPGSAGRSSQPPSQPSGQPSGPAGQPGTAPPVAGGAGKSPDIYAWLPFTQSELASAARVTTTFAADYGTFSYRQSTASYLAPMKPIMTTQLAELIGRAYSAPGVVAQRNSGKQASAGSAVIDSLRAFGPSSLTFVVTVTERNTSSKGPSQQTVGYAITVTGSAANWQVSNVEYESDGNQ